MSAFRFRNKHTHIYIYDIDTLILDISMATNWPCPHVRSPCSPGAAPRCHKDKGVAPMLHPTVVDHHAQQGEDLWRWNAPFFWENGGVETPGNVGKMMVSLTGKNWFSDDFLHIFPLNSEMLSEHPDHPWPICAPCMVLLAAKWRCHVRLSVSVGICVIHGGKGLY